MLWLDFKFKKAEHFSLDAFDTYRPHRWNMATTDRPCLSQKDTDKLNGQWTWLTIAIYAADPAIELALFRLLFSATGYFQNHLEHMHHVIYVTSCWHNKVGQNELKIECTCCFGTPDLRITACTSFCISHGPCQWERAIFDPPQLRDPWTDFHETWNRSKVKRSQRHVTYPGKIAITQYWWSYQVHTWKLTWWTTPPTSGAQNGCHGNTGCLAMGPQNLQFMVEYFKTQRSTNFNIGIYFQHGS